ncbi:hypothetical protein [Sporosarcina sp. G11-34]|uniref:hypothetical protein n=1 Tax=Sporosarcina sp. G11-34 TaxID=2849605 RepID=UPI0022A93F39|nr:hypothetical protein [Sporosarcina sp. G11-34]MCZ2259824.1 hypothetical protein [Sporosarcina sp. G11-34]
MSPEINLLPQIDRVSTGKRWLSIILAATFALILIYLIFQYFSLSKNVNNLIAEEQLLLTEKAELEASLITLEEPQVVDLGTSVEFVESVSYPVSPLLIEINKYVNEHTYLRDYLFSENTIQFEVDFETIGEVVTYVGDLAGSPYLEDVKVEEISTFNPAPSTSVEEEEKKTDSFDEVERFTNIFTVTIDSDYLRTGGEVQ